MTDAEQAGPRGVRVLKGVSRIARTEQVRTQLERAIRDGEFSPGERLPSERELAEMLGVSRVSVREALRSLEALGLVEIQHGRGCFVAEAPADGYSSSFSRWLEMHASELLELIEVRGALDELAAQRAAERSDAEARRELREAHERFEMAARDPAVDVVERVRLDVAFHDGVARAAGSPLLADLVGELHQYMAESRRITLDPDLRARQSAAEHAAILEAIKIGDPDGARGAVAAHIESVRRSIMDALPAGADLPAAGEGVAHPVSRAEE